MIQSEGYYQKMEEAYSKRIDELMKENAELKSFRESNQIFIADVCVRNTKLEAVARAAEALNFVGDGKVFEKAYGDLQQALAALRESEKTR